MRARTIKARNRALSSDVFTARNNIAQARVLCPRACAPPFVLLSAGNPLKWVALLRAQALRGEILWDSDSRFVAVGFDDFAMVGRMIGFDIIVDRVIGFVGRELIIRDDKKSKFPAHRMKWSGKIILFYYST